MTDTLVDLASIALADLRGETPEDQDFEAAETVVDAIHRAGWVIVCDECWHVPDTDVPIRHRVAVSDGTDDGGEIACIWECGHAVEVGRPCRACVPTPEEPF